MKIDRKNAREKLELFYYTEYLLYIEYSNKKSYSKSAAEEISKKFCEFYKFDVKGNEYQKMYDFAQMDVEYMEKLSTIINMYNTFEQFLKVFLKFQKSNKSLNKKVNAVGEHYEYTMENNSYYEKVEKYRMINNAIKHGDITKDVQKNYPELINKKCDIREFGTILDNSLNISDDDITECFTNLCLFVGEMYEYFENFGYIN